MSVESRLKNLERIQRPNGKATFIFYHLTGETEPSGEEIEEAKTAFVNKFGKPRSGVAVLNAFNGVISSGEVELARYEYQTMSNEEYREYVAINFGEATIKGKKVKYSLVTKEPNKLEQEEI